MHDHTRIRTRVHVADAAVCCGHTLQATDFFTFTGLQIAAIVVVVIFNTLMKTTTLMLGFFERHHTIAEQVCMHVIFCVCVCL